MDNTPSTYTKPQPVVMLGAIIAGLTATLSALTIIFKDSPQVILVLGIIGAVVTGATVFKDQYVKAQVVPFVDTASYINEQGETVAGPASPLDNGTPIERDSVVATPEAEQAPVIDEKKVISNYAEGGELPTPVDGGKVVNLSGEAEPLLPGDEDR